MIINVGTISKKDLRVRTQWINDRRVNKYLYLQIPVSLKDTTSWFSRASKSANRFDLVFRTVDGEAIGMAGITAIDKVFSNAEIYIFVDPEWHGQGLGKAIIAWLLDYSFYVLELNRIYLYTDPENLVGVRLYERLGFLLEGRLREHRMKDGEVKDKLVYGMLSSEWAGTPHAIAERFTIVASGKEDYKAPPRGLKMVVQHQK
ncbi:MAG TPA: GNAT family protein [Sphingobacteriaceae bacterium]